MDLLERPSNQLTTEPTTNLDPNTLHLDFPHDKNITSTLQALAKEACNANEKIAPAKKKRIWKKVALLSDGNIVPARKKKPLRTRKVRPRKKKRRTKKTLFVVELKPDKTKVDSVERLGFEVSNANKVVKSASKLSNMDNEAKSGSDNGEGEKSGNESIGETKIRIM